MNRNLIAGAAGALTLVLAGYVRHVERRLEDLELEPRTNPAHVQDLLGDLQRVRAEVRSVDANRAAEREEIRLGLALLNERSETVARAAQAARERLEELEARWNEHSPADLATQLEQEIARLRGELEARTAELDSLAASAASLAREDAVLLSELRAEVEPLVGGRDAQGMWNELVGPVVQLAGEATVGSGVLLESRPLEDGGWLTYLLTSWHVVRDIYGSIERVETPVSVKLYLADGGTRFESARMVEYDVALDVALLALESRERMPCGARLASRERVEAVRIFDSIYAVGCPLGNDPIPTPGEIAAASHDVEGGHYWMISAPTYIGNSGGGIFDARSHELLGIFSKIYTHGAARTTIVPHMGLATPLSVVYGWLDDVGQSAVVDSQAPAALDVGARAASATLEE